MLILGHHQNNKMNSMTTFTWCKRGIGLYCPVMLSAGPLIAMIMTWLDDLLLGYISLGTSICPASISWNGATVLSGMGMCSCALM